jgi:hypothetical protein
VANEDVQGSLEDLRFELLACKARLAEYEAGTVRPCVTSSPQPSFPSSARKAPSFIEESKKKMQRELGKANDSILIGSPFEHLPSPAPGEVTPEQIYEMR